MKSKYSTLFIAGVMFGVLIFCQAAWAALTPDETLSVSPQTVRINAFFAGETLTVTGTIPAQENVILEISGREAKSEFDLKGRMGPFWMTRGNVTLDHAPALYLLLLPGDDTTRAQVKRLGLGMDHLKQTIRATGSVKVPGDIFDSFCALKKKEGLYRTVTGAVTYSQEKNGGKTFVARCKLPALMGTGAYQVTATRLSPKGVTGRMTSSFSAEQVGFVKLIDHLASDRRIAYGVTAVMVALVAGIVMGLVFRQGGGSH